MIKIIGNLFLVCMLFGIQLNADVTMQLRTTDGKTLQHALVGQPFTIEVAVSDMSRDVAEPKIFASSEIDLQRTGLYMSSINGRATKKYSYLARIDVPGTYTLGPATLEHNGYVYQSEKYTLEVLHEQQRYGSSGLKKTKVESDDIFLRLYVDEQQAFVGQKVRCSIRFYTNNASVHLEHLSPPVIKNVSLSDMQGPEMGTEEIDGKQYHYAQWSWNMYPKKVGELVIPAYCADYNVSTKKNRLFHGLSSLLSFGSNNKRVYSNSATLFVDELPPHEKNISAVGAFKSFSATITPGIAKEGEGVLLTFNLEGEGNWQQIEFKTLENIPEALKYYDSNVALHENKEHAQGRKQFEFIVQGIESGNWEIPSQTLTYFDTNAHTYKTLYTAPLEITITPNAQLVQQKNVIPGALQANELHNSSSSQIFAPNKHFCKSPNTNKKNIDWFLFYFCMLFPVFGYMSFGGYRNYVVNSRLHFLVVSYLSMRKAFKDLDMLEKVGRPDQVHNVFVNFLSTSYIYSSREWSQIIKDIDARMAGVTVAHKTWKEFYAQVVAVAFDSSDRDETYDEKELFQDARAWVHLIHKKIR